MKSLVDVRKTIKQYVPVSLWSVKNRINSYEDLLIFDVQIAVFVAMTLEDTTQQHCRFCSGNWDVHMSSA